MVRAEWCFPFLNQPADVSRWLFDREQFQVCCISAKKYESYALPCLHLLTVITSARVARLGKLG